MNNENVNTEAVSGTALNRQKLDLSPGKLVSLAGVVLRLTEILDFDTVVGVEVESGRSRALRIQELKPITDASAELLRVASADTEDIADEDWKVAEHRYAAIKPLISAQDSGRRAVEERAKELGVDPATLYRWLLRFRSLGVVAALIPRKRGWKPGNSRISKHAEAIIHEVKKTPT